MIQNTNCSYLVRISTALLTAVVLAVSLSTQMATSVEAKTKGGAKIVFVSTRSEGKGVDNPEADTEIFSMNPDGTGLKQLTRNGRNDNRPSVSRDGSRIAYESDSDEVPNPEGDTEIYIMNADGSGKKNLTNNSIPDIDPDISPDGNSIAYETYGAQSSNPEGDEEVYVMSADGSGKKNLTDNALNTDSDPAYAPDGRVIAYLSRGDATSNPEGDHEIYAMKAANGSGKRNLTNSGANVFEADPAYSPDGASIAYRSSGVQNSNPDGNSEIYVMLADGSGQTNLTDTPGGPSDRVFVYNPSYAPDGERIAYESFGPQTSNPEGDTELYLMNALDGSRQTNLTNNETSGDYHPDWFTKGKLR